MSRPPGLPKRAPERSVREEPASPTIPDPHLLLIDDDVDRRKHLSEAAPDGVSVRALTPAELDAALLVDAIGAMIVVDERFGEPTVIDLEPLLELQVASAIVLVFDGADAAARALAIARLAPARIASIEMPRDLLRWQLAQALPDRDGSGKVRPGQRTTASLRGVSHAIHRIGEQIERVAESRMSILILGETGTGKEIVARAVHEQSDRSSGPFVAVNCSALPDSLLESELFGYERGAFSGAEGAKPGLFEQASGGTFFLDEIGDATPALQAKLLRVLESRELRRLGGTLDRAIDVRVVSATHKDLDAAVERGEFRQDLMFRLNAATIVIPPLRRRRVDIPFLAQLFAEQFGEEHARRIALADDFLQALGERDFPGNVRELRNAVERAITLARPGETLSRRHLQGMDAAGEAEDASDAARGTLKARVERLERAAIVAALARCAGNRTKAAEALGLSRLGLRNKMKRFEVE